MSLWVSRKIGTEIFSCGTRRLALLPLSEGECNLADITLVSDADKPDTVKFLNESSIHDILLNGSMLCDYNMMKGQTDF